VVQNPLNQKKPDGDQQDPPARDCCRPHALLENIVHREPPIRQIESLFRWEFPFSRRGKSGPDDAPGDLQRSVPLSLQFFDLINLVHSEHVLLPAGYPTEFSRRFLPTIIMGKFDDYFVHFRLIILRIIRIS
jgi:hypothetical protein